MANDTTFPSRIVSFNNAQHFISTKLTHENYDFWSTQITLLLQGLNLMCFLDGTCQCPPPTNLDYAHWVRQDQLIMSFLISSLSEQVFVILGNFDTSLDIWITLNEALASSTNKLHLHNIKEGDQIIKHVDPSLYQAIVDNNLHFLQQNKDQLHVQLTPNKNTLLHVVAQFHDSVECVNEILDIQSSTIKRTMLTWKNSTGETALHIAATNGRFNIVGTLIRHAKDLEGEEVESCGKLAEEMMKTTNQLGDTALHMAVRRKHEEIVKLLVEEDPEFTHPSNKMEETPLYLAVECGSLGMVDSILKVCRSPGYRGPRGRTALHVAVLAELGDTYFSTDCIEKLLEHMQDLTKEVDEFGWSPLHFAARFNLVESAKVLLIYDVSAAYIMADKDGNKTALHVAACHGNIDVIKVLLEYCPDCWEMTTSQGQNVIHLAVDKDKYETVEFLVTQPWATNLVNGKDNEGNTPLHLYVYYEGYLEESLVSHMGANTNAFNQKNMTPLDVVCCDSGNKNLRGSKKRLLRKHGGRHGCRDLINQRDGYLYRKLKNAAAVADESVLSEYKNTHLLIAALIATVTFASGFTLPGGYDGNEGPNQGMAVLVRKASFRAFMVSDTIAVMSSILAVIQYMLATGYVPKDKVIHRLNTGRALILVAMAGMTIAFTTGLYAVLAPCSLGLAITVCTFGCFCILLFFSEVYRLFK